MRTTIDRYFNWICNLVAPTQHDSYSRLLTYLHSRGFYYSKRVPLDENRLTDGVNLRYRFGYENNIQDSLISRYLGTGPCSVLEMMAALALRCEEKIMVDADIGNRTGTWFWSMINSLGLGDMDNDNYDGDYVDFVITRFLNREYETNGKGGLFTVDKQRDMRKVEIWCQLMWYLESIM